MPEVRELGRSGISIPPLVLGGNVFGWTADRGASFDVLDAFVAGGGTMIDTADSYQSWVPGHQGGESETVIGEWLRQSNKRAEVVIATKTGMLMGDGTEGLAVDRIERAVEASLKRLGTDYLDVFFAHRDDATVPLEDVIECFDRLIRAGKVRVAAASNYSAERLGEALGISEARGLARYELLQPWFNLLDRDQFEGALQHLCIDRTIGCIPYFGLASGFLTGKYRSPADLEGRARGDRVKGYLNDRGSAVLDTMDEVASETGASLSQVALAWLAAQPGVTAPIASATSVTQVEDLIGALHLTLSPEQVSRLDLAGQAVA